MAADTTPTLVHDYGDLASDRTLKGDDPDFVARELQAATGDEDALVAWLPEWLVDEKDIDPVGRSEHIVSGRIDHETEKAYLLVERETGTESWLPKSVIHVYRAADDANLSIPQATLTEHDPSTDSGGSA